MYSKIASSPFKSGSRAKYDKSFQKKKFWMKTGEKKTCDGGNSIEFESNKNAGGEKKRLQLELV